ncbi:MAG: hypothetical protein ACJA01_000103 [Saprospiraceae bacterium]|jgi:hypothetical protein
MRMYRVSFRTQENKRTYKDLGMASVALLRRGETIDDLRIFVKNQNLAWTHIADDSRSEEFSIVTLRVEVYCTYILMDPNGKILFNFFANSNSTSRLNEILYDIYAKED